MLNRHIQRNGVICLSFIILLSFLVYIMICIIVLFVLYTVYIALGRSMIELLTKVAEDTDSHQSPAIYLLLRGHDHGHFQAKTGSPVKRLIKYLNFILLLKYMDFSFNEYQFKDQKKYFYKFMENQVFNSLTFQPSSCLTMYFSTANMKIDYFK